MRRKRVITDLAGMQAECEINYLRLMKLFPEWKVWDRCEFALELCGFDSCLVQIMVQERNPYTTSMLIQQQDMLLPWLTGPELQVRVYHDAKMAEIVACDKHRNLHPKYNYPNKNMYQPDEKAQLNKFLGEWLALCLQHGRVLEPVTG